MQIVHDCRKQVSGEFRGKFGVNLPGTCGTNLRRESGAAHSAQFTRGIARKSGETSGSDHARCRETRRNDDLRRQALERARNRQMRRYLTPQLILSARIGVAAGSCGFAAHGAGSDPREQLFWKAVQRRHTHLKDARRGSKVSKHFWRRAVRLGAAGCDRDVCRTIGDPSRSRGNDELCVEQALISCAHSSPRDAELRGQIAPRR